jgi:hypothetical protein
VAQRRGPKKLQIASQACVVRVEDGKLESTGVSQTTTANNLHANFNNRMFVTFDKSQKGCCKPGPADMQNHFL